MYHTDGVGGVETMVYVLERKRSASCRISYEVVTCEGQAAIANF